MTNLLERSGITARYLRPPADLSSRGCGYAVRIGANHLQMAVGLLRPQGLEPIRIYSSGEDGVYREVMNF